jgi:Mn-containing catalase
MFYHVRGSRPVTRLSRLDPRLAGLLLEQFAGHDELKAATRYFVQAFRVRQLFPDKYDLLMDTTHEELSHFEIAGATIARLLDSLGGDLRNAAERSDLMGLLQGKAEKRKYLQEARAHPKPLVLSGNAYGDPAARPRVRIIYRYLQQFTDDSPVQRTLGSLMTREIASFRTFSAAAGI